MKYTFEFKLDCIEKYKIARKDRNPARRQEQRAVL